ncbi:MAG: signal peptidase I [Campylobacterota bacterium]|nr:signal peptidase I [Campylobacterota bacterium]
MKKILHKAHKFSNSWTGTIIIVLFVIFFIAQAFRIPSGSMKDSLLIGDHLFAKKFAYGITMPHIPFLEVSVAPWSDSLRLMDGDKPSRGDIVIFRPPHNTKQHYVKRCVALPGDELFILNKDLYLHHNEGDEWIKKEFKDYETIVFAGKIWVKNPYMKQHPGIHHDTKIINDGKYPMPIFNFAPIKVDEDNYFMMGDNRDHSNDSRFWGGVPYDNIEGTPWFIYFSIDDNWEIRWDRVGKTPTDLESPDILDRAREERLRVDKDDHGIY